MAAFDFPCPVADMACVNGRALLASAAWGMLAGLAVSVTATAMDWHVNPAGLFHGESGTHWPVVLETAWSWFWPVACAATALSAVVKAALGWRARPGAG